MVLSLRKRSCRIFIARPTFPAPILPPDMRIYFLDLSSPSDFFASDFEYEAVKSKRHGIPKGISFSLGIPRFVYSFFKSAEGII